MNRRQMREHCFKMLFCSDFYPGNEIDEQLLRYFEQDIEDEQDENGKNIVLHSVLMTEEDRKELVDKVGDILEKLEEIDEALSNIAKGWKLSRMGKVERSILRLAYYEMKYDDKIPEKVAINEAVELSKEFGGDDTYSFVNGILANLV